MLAYFLIMSFEVSRYSMMEQESFDHARDIISPFLSLSFMIKESMHAILRGRVICNAKDAKIKWKQIVCFARLLFTKLSKLKVLLKIKSNYKITMIKVKSFLFFSNSNLFFWVKSLSPYFFVCGKQIEELCSHFQHDFQHHTHFLGRKALLQVCCN